MTQVAPLDPTVASLFNAFNGQFQKATVNSNMWPPEGTHVCDVVNMVLKPGEFKFKNGQNVESKAPCIDCFFVYNRIVSKDDPDFKEGTSYEFMGERFQLLPVPADAPHNQVQRIEIAANRFLTHLCVMLNKPAEEVKQNVLGSAQNLKNRIENSSSALTVQIKVSKRENPKDKDKPYCSESLVANLSAAPVP